MFFPYPLRFYMLRIVDWVRIPSPALLLWCINESSREMFCAGVLTFTVHLLLNRTFLSHMDAITWILNLSSLLPFIHQSHYFTKSHSDLKLRFWT